MLSAGPGAGTARSMLWAFDGDPSCWWFNLPWFLDVNGDYNLVGGRWFGTFFIFHKFGRIVPTDFHIFQRGWNHQPDLICLMAYQIDSDKMVCWQGKWHRMSGDCFLRYSCKLFESTRHMSGGVGQKLCLPLVILDMSANGGWSCSVMPVSNGYVVDSAHPNVEQNGSSCKPESVADSQDSLLPWSACQLWWALQSLRPRSMDKARGLRRPRVLHDTKKIHGWTIGRTIKGPFWSFKATSCCIPVCNLVNRLFEDVWTVFCFVHNYPLVN